METRESASPTRCRSSVFDTEACFKPNATLNMMWALSLHNAQSSEVACQDRPAVEATRKTGTLPLLSYAYNPIGRMIVRISSIATSSYTGRLCELEALQRNLALQIGPG